MMKTEERQAFAARQARERTQRVSRAEAADFSLASIGLRCGALLLDYILMLIVPAVTVSLALIFKRVSLGAAYFVLVLGYAATLGLLVLNWIYLCGSQGQTAGKRIIGIRIVRTDGTPINFKTAVLRHVVGYPLAFLSFGLGALWVLWDARQQGWHDKLADTLVIKD